MRPDIANKIAVEITGLSFSNIKPLTGGRNSQIFQLNKSDGCYALKFFRTDENNSRDRFDAEIFALKLFAENGIQCVPKLIAHDREKNCILMEWITGEHIEEFNLNDINSLSSFVKTIHEISKTIITEKIRFATEACLNGKEIVSQIKRRIKCLEASIKAYPELKEFLNKDFIPTFLEKTNSIKAEYNKNDLVFDQDISPLQLTLSPVDIGSHNCLRNGNKLYFLDFEFFGRDDPVKLVADTLQHPGSILGQKANDVLRNKISSIFSDDEFFLTRLNCLYPLFGLKWCLIVLNPYLLNYQMMNDTNSDVQKTRLHRAKSILAGIQEANIK